MILGFVAIDTVLLALAAIRPWVGFVLLLAGLPFNGFLTNVVRVQLSLDDAEAIALAAWHDALLIGVVAAAARELVRRRAALRLHTVELLGAAILGFGIVYVVLSPRTVAALYAYRTLYEPIILGLAIARLATMEPVPSWALRAAVWAVVGGGLVAALYTWFQVYVGGFHYIDVYYRDPGQPFPAAYAATFVHQPRGIGTSQGPNEFGAYLALVMVVLASPPLLRLPLAVRSTFIGATVLAMLLSFSRSGWLATAVGVAVVIALSRERLPSRRNVTAALRTRRVWLAVGVPAGITLSLATAVLFSSGAPKFISETVSGREPSAGGRPTDVVETVERIAVTPLGAGLGTAGPKSVRFDPSGAGPPFSSEVWYLNYTAQVGIFGLGLLAAFVVRVLSDLWRAKAYPWARVAMAALIGLGVAAFFIPIVEEPAVAIPLWSFVGLGLGGARRAQEA